MLDPLTPARSFEAPPRRAPAAAPENLPDLLLIERARLGEEAAVDTLIRRYGRRLYRVARCVILDEERALPIVQEAFLTAFADLHRYEPTGRFAAWLTRLSYQQARAQRAGMRFAGSSALRPEPAPADAGEQAQLEAAIAALPEVFRTVFVMRFVEGISGIETAASLGVHETTVRTRLYRAQKRLGAPAVQRVRATAVLELAPERLELLAQRIRAQLPHPVAPATP